MHIEVYVTDISEVHPQNFSFVEGGLDLEAVYNVFKKLRYENHVSITVI